jgi:hypothetical protein
MKKLTFHIRCSFTCEDGSKFGFTFAESEWCVPDAPSKVVGDEVVVYTPQECIERAMRTFLSGLTERERKQAAKTLEIEARQVKESDSTMNRPHCKRSTGTERAWFRTRAEAEAFAQDPDNPAYHGDLPHFCANCDFYHLSKPEWLEPRFSAEDLDFLSECGINNSARLRCAVCRREFQENVEFLILRDGATVHEDCIP